MYRVNDNPIPRFPEGRPLEADLGAWRVAHLKSRRDKQFAGLLAEKEVGYYMPLFEKRTRRKDNNKPRKSIVPLFQGYIAVVYNKVQAPVFQHSPDLVRLIPVSDQPRFVQELKQVQRLLDADVPLQLHQGLPAGTPVVMRSGPFAGLEGTVLRDGGEARLYVGIELFGQSVSLQIHDGDAVKKQ